MSRSVDFPNRVCVVCATAFLTNLSDRWTCSADCEQKLREDAEIEAAARVGAEQASIPEPLDFDDDPRDDDTESDGAKRFAPDAPGLIEGEIDTAIALLSALRQPDAIRVEVVRSVVELVRTILSGVSVSLGDDDRSRDVRQIGDLPPGPGR